MNKVAVIIPIYHRESDTIKCIDSFKNLVHGGNEIIIYLAINGASEGLMKYLVETTKDIINSNISVSVRTEDVNLGKPKVVNYHAERAIRDNDVDFIISMDSDMVPEDNAWILKFIDSWNSLMLSSSIRVGAICGNQSGQNCHVPLEAQVFTASERQYTSATGNNGIAGGVLFTSSQMWESVGGYHAHRVYGSDDGHFCLAMQQRNFRVVISNDNTFYHPFPDDAGYVKWKQKAIQDNLSEEEKKGYYDIL